MAALSCQAEAFEMLKFRTENDQRSKAVRLVNNIPTDQESQDKVTAKHEFSKLRATGKVMIRKMIRKQTAGFFRLRNFVVLRMLFPISDFLNGMFPFEKPRYYNHMKVPLGIPSFKKRATVVIIINIKFIPIVILSLLLLLLLLLLKLLLLLFGQKQAVGKFLRKPRKRAVVGRYHHSSASYNYCYYYCYCMDYSTQWESS